MAEQTITIENMEHLMLLFGHLDSNIELINKHFNVNSVVRGNEIKVSGAEPHITKAKKAIVKLLELIQRGEVITEQDVHYMLTLVEEGNEAYSEHMANNTIAITAKGKPIKPKTIGQQEYVQAIHNHTITLGVGPAGTGKTFLAVAMAAQAFRMHQVSRIILTRPAVEAGEKLGFLPGDLQSKVDPYLRPLYDALFDMFGPENYAKHLERGSIEIAPLAYMRGRTLEDSFIILDEAQNTTPEQMKMFLTRLGFHSKMVITGDTTQIDLPPSQVSGLVQATQILKDVPEIALVYFSDKDVVRHKLVQQIVLAYEHYNINLRSGKDDK